MKTTDHPFSAHVEFIEDAIGELVESGRILEVIVPPLLVKLIPCQFPFKSGSGKKWLRYLNKCLRKMRVKYED